MIWRWLERTGAQGVSFVVSIVLAQLLGPEVYGTVALITVFTAILQVFVDSGMGTALIQKKDADDLDFSSLFYFNVAMCLALYAAIFIAAPCQVLSKAGADAAGSRAQLDIGDNRRQEHPACLCFPAHDVQKVLLRHP